MKLIHDFDEDVLVHTYAVYSNYDFTGTRDQQTGGSAYEYDYDSQYGGLIPGVFTEYGVFNNQEGGGLGSILSSIGRFFKPLFFSGLKAVGKQAAKTVGALAGDLVAGADWREAGEKRLREAGGELVNKFGDKVSAMAGLGYGPQYGMSQFGGGNKSVHSAVKLFSFSPPSAVRGPRAPQRKRKRSSAAGKPRAAKRRRVQRKKGGAPVKRRRKRAGAKRKRGGKKRRKRVIRQAIGHGYSYPPF
jgi:hypothetical protein